MEFNKKSKTELELDLLRQIQKSKTSQRKMADILGFSLGKLNYCLNELKKKGFLKINNFSQKKNKLNYARYVLTPKGISHRTKLTIEFMKRKMQEYDELKKELEKENN
jgi:EPS-associated MarR family transcriptional regulator